MRASQNSRLDKVAAAVGVVVSEDIAGDQEEDADEDVAVVDEGVQKAEVRRREVKENDEDGEQGADAGEGGERGFAGGGRPSGWHLSLLRLGLSLGFSVFVSRSRMLEVTDYVLLFGCGCGALANAASLSLTRSFGYKTQFWPI